MNMVCEDILTVSSQHRVLCIVSGEVAHGVFVQHEPVFRWLWGDSFSFMWALPFVMCCCFVWGDVVLVVVLLAVIVWLNS